MLNSVETMPAAGQILPANGETPTALHAALRAAPRLLVVSHDAHDARFHKRMQMFSDLGFAVSWLAFDRARDTRLAR